jgi:hypothetical protein
MTHSVSQIRKLRKLRKSLLRIFDIMFHVRDGTNLVDALHISYHLLEFSAYIQSNTSAGNFQGRLLKYGFSIIERSQNILSPLATYNELFKPTEYFSLIEIFKFATDQWQFYLSSYHVGIRRMAAASYLLDGGRYLVVSARMQFTFC